MLVRWRPIQGIKYQNDIYIVWELNKDPDPIYQITKNIKTCDGMSLQQVPQNDAGWYDKNRMIFWKFGNNYESFDIVDYYKLI